MSIIRNAGLINTKLIFANNLLLSVKLKTAILSIVRL